MSRALPNASRDALLAALTVTLVGATAWLIVQPHTADMAAQVFRAGVAKREGLAIWDGQWYGGHYMPAYSLLMPLFGGLIGAWWAGALACIAAGLGLAAVASLAAGEDRQAALWGAALFATGAVASLWCGRTTFLLGIAFGAWALAALLSRRPWAWLPLALLTATASPVAALFLAICGVGFVAGSRRFEGLALSAAAIIPAYVLSLAFPEGGSQPFNWMQFTPIVVGCVIALMVAPKRLSQLRLGVAVYLTMSVLLYLVDTPVGGNVARLGALSAAPIAAIVLLTDARKRLLAALIPLALIWQWTAPITDNIRVAGDRSTAESFYRPLINELDRRGGPPGRVEVVWTRSHWESALLAPSHPLARGWERQLDRRYNAAVNGPSVAPQTYRRWLDGLAVRWVALPNAPLDLSVKGEAKLVREGLSWLRAVWVSPDWRLYEVVNPNPISTGAATTSHLGPQSVDLNSRSAGDTLVRVRWNRLWKLSRGKGCVGKGPGGMTRVHMDTAGAASLEIGAVTGSPSPCPQLRR